MNYFVYMIECSDGTYYVGVTNDVFRRVQEHQDGLNKTCYTFKRRPVLLKYYLEFDYIDEAIILEKRLKKWSRTKKEAYFKREWIKLKGSLSAAMQQTTKTT